MLVDDLLHKPNFLEPKNLSGKATLHICARKSSHYKQKMVEMFKNKCFYNTSFFKPMQDFEIGSSMLSLICMDSNALQRTLGGTFLGLHFIHRLFFEPNL